MASITALTAGLAPHVYANEDNTIKVALVGAGGRGAGAAMNALSVEDGPIKLVAMADVFEDKLNRSHYALAEEFSEDKLDVPEERRFLGFDSYKKAMDCLDKGDVVILATPPAFRWPHFRYAIDKGLNVFMEKPVTVDGPTSRKMLELAEESIQKNLKVGVGLMCRHCDARKELFDRVKSGQIGDIITLRAYRMHGPGGSFYSGPKPPEYTDLMYQIRRFHSYIWLSGGCYSDFYIHNIDECCWMKDAWPVRAKGVGGRHYRGDAIDQNFDNYSVEYTFADGTKLFLYGRNMEGCFNEFASFAHGSKGAAVISSQSHTPARSRIMKNQDFDSRDNVTWAFPQPERNPYQLEWDHLIDAIRNDKFFNEVKRGVEASLVSSMGRMSAHTGQIVTYEQMLNCEHEMAPNVDKLTEKSDSPLMPGPDGKYPVPEPGIVTDREYKG
jgi:predicted dehydrogenase